MSLSRLLVTSVASILAIQKVGCLWFLFIVACQQAFFDGVKRILLVNELNFILISFTVLLHL